MQGWESCGDGGAGEAEGGECEGGPSPSSTTHALGGFGFSQTLTLSAELVSAGRKKPASLRTASAVRE